ncbi:MAG: hypothetical protein K2Q28_15705 [Hyphomicrobium sp.]|nr:hypothetical protein [Hyphomicrobium sp.]
MQVSIIGLLVVGVLLLVGRMWGGGIIVALFASLTFGSTAFAILTALGGSSPQIYTLLVAIMFLSVLVARGGVHAYCRAFLTHQVSWYVALLMLYAIVGSVVLPRLFAGETTVFVTASAADASSVTAIGRGMIETTLGPVSGNISQTAYFCLSLLSFFAVTAYLDSRSNLTPARDAFFAFAIFTALFGALDLLFKLIGVVDVFEFLRTATYSMSTNHSEHGFWRIAGGFPEASAYSMSGLAGLAFSFTYWRLTGNRLALVLAVVICLLLLLSTSSTAYVGLLVLFTVAGIRAVVEVATDRITRSSLAILSSVAVGVTAIAFLAVANASVFNAIAELFDSMLLNKATSASAVERGYWNAKSLDGFTATYGLGIGIGSSRASSLLVAYVSQLGLPGLILIGPILLSAIWWPIEHGPNRDSGCELVALGRAASASAFAWLLGLSISAGNADLGVYFFASLAVVVTCRFRLLSFLEVRSRNAETGRDIAMSW